jgi:hypothetical protein
MRLSIILVTFVGVVFAQDTESNMACVERLQMPVYPKLAEAASIRGSITATVVISPTGSIQSTLSGHKLLSPAVEKALRASIFRKSCGGKSVTLLFNFVVGDGFDPEKLPQRISFGYPNEFWISVPPRVISDAP